MERTLTRIKNLKTRRKLSLPASPNPAYLPEGKIVQRASFDVDSVHDLNWTLKPAENTLKNTNTTDKVSPRRGRNVEDKTGVYGAGANSRLAHRTVSERYAKTYSGQGSNNFNNKIESVVRSGNNNIRRPMSAMDNARGRCRSPVNDTSCSEIITSATKEEEVTKSVNNLVNGSPKGLDKMSAKSQSIGEIL